ncbi:hypothetical protein E2562_032149 [Oryza meyeriana var. granulata]|uniref:Uncharacterized protein n=1 Tax=Oryza meyeriana var. granulata TaxID=110450 RepID=A0A6G1E7E1_9ORYZ|nr:hypothetical protein E2562_032149 [Oryza meyeriana var. granulata]
MAVDVGTTSGAIDLATGWHFPLSSLFFSRLAMPLVLRLGAVGYGNVIAAAKTAIWGDDRRGTYYMQLQQEDSSCIKPVIFFTKVRTTSPEKYFVQLNVGINSSSI